MNLLFNIQAPEIDTNEAHLFIEIASVRVSLIVLDKNNVFCAVVIYSFWTEINTVPHINQLNKFLQNEPLLQKQYKKTAIIWNFKESILVPNECMDGTENDKMLDLVYGNLNKGDIKSDFILNYNFHNVYRIPAVVTHAVVTKFPYAIQIHQYSLLPNFMSKKENQLLAIFYDYRVTVLLCKEGQLQLIQNFSFTNTAGAIYHLLNVCENFDVSLDTLTLQLSGAIDKNSNLYENLCKYFSTIHFMSLPENYKYHEEIKNYPEHFFSHLFALATCV